MIVASAAHLELGGAGPQQRAVQPRRESALDRQHVDDDLVLQAGEAEAIRWAIRSGVHMSRHSSDRGPASTTVASMLPVWSSPGRVWERRSVDVCCGLVGVAGGVGTRVGGAQGADRTCVRQGRNTGDRRSLSRRLVVRGYAQNRLASGRAGRA